MRSSKLLNLLWLALGLFLLEEGYRLGLGESRKPGSGLFPFIIGLFILLVSLILLLQEARKNPECVKEGQKRSYVGFLLCLSSLYCYVIVFEYLGFIITTFLFIFFLLKKVEQKGWLLSAATAVVTSAVAYLFFETALRAALPRGIFGF
jgi:putative tricarboxylic transport membrane protein